MKSVPTRSVVVALLIVGCNASVDPERPLDSETLFRGASCIGQFDGFRDTGGDSSSSFLDRCLEEFPANQLDTFVGAYCSGFGIAYNLATGIGPADERTLALQIACTDLLRQDPGDEGEAEIERRARILIGQGSRTYVTDFQDAPGVVQDLVGLESLREYAASLISTTTTDGPDGT